MMLNTPKRPSPQVGDLAGLLHDLRSMTPKHLADVRDTIKEFHAAEAAATARLSEAEQAEKQASARVARAASREMAMVEVATQNEAEHKARMDEVVLREQTCDQRGLELDKREEVVAYAERRIQQTRANLELVE